MQVILNMGQGGDYMETEGRDGGYTLHTYLEGKLGDKHLKSHSGQLKAVCFVTVIKIFCVKLPVYTNSSWQEERQYPYLSGLQLGWRTRLPGC